DRPILPARQVPSLVRPDGRFWPLREYLCRLCLGRIRREDIAAELGAQYRHFTELTGEPPPAVNGHHHIHIFPPVATVLEELLAPLCPAPYLRRVQEPWRSLLHVPGARLKRCLLSLLGKTRQPLLPGNDVLMGVTDPPCVADPLYLTRWLRQVRGDVVELTCHPGLLDDTLAGRDGG